MKRKIYISGMNSGQNPSSGLGIARCLRRAFPQLHLVGVDHWQGSSGLHESTIDEVLLLPSWNQMDDDLHADRIRSILESGNLWISSMDMEVHWLSENVGPHRNLLAPGGSALERTSKPKVEAFQPIGFRVPDFIPATLPDSEVHAFLRKNAWQCWLKSPYHDARRISNWGSFERGRDYLSQNWKTSNLFLQRNVLGNEETIAFCAYQGDLLGAVRMEKRQLTPEGKTWAGRVSPVDKETWEQMRQVVRSLEWSGGGELEFVRDPDRKSWIIECNPRFPAWIYGSAIAGMNIPAALVSHVLGLPMLEPVSPYPFFTRVVHEIPAKESVGIPLPPDPSNLGWSGEGKGGKGGESFAQLLPNLGEQDDSEDEDEDQSEKDPLPAPAALADEIDRLSRRFEGESPTRVFLEAWAGHRFKELAQKVRGASLAQPAIQIGYSVKTSPTDSHLRMAQNQGFFAECISQKEVQRALSFGFPSHQVILNGPGKFWPLHLPPAMGLHMLFCDSVEEFDRVSELPGIARVLGFRIRLPKLASRFGNSFSRYEKFEAIVERAKRLRANTELGFHFHMPSWSIGVQRWMNSLEAILLWCQSVRDLSGVAVTRLDLGGGFFPDDLGNLDFTPIQSLVNDRLPEVKSLYFEPGRALTQDTEILVSRVLDVRKKCGEDPMEVVVDACIAELPLAQTFPHRIFFRPKTKANGPADALTPLTKGKARILGRICMEDDILCSSVTLPESIDVGDFLIFGDAGGYERSMSYGFGRG